LFSHDGGLTKKRVFAGGELVVWGKSLQRLRCKGKCEGGGLLKRSRSEKTIIGTKGKNRGLAGNQKKYLGGSFRQKRKQKGRPKKSPKSDDSKREAWQSRRKKGIGGGEGQSPRPPAG